METNKMDMREKISKSLIEQLETKLNKFKKKDPGLITERHVTPNSFNF